MSLKRQITTGVITPSRREKEIAERFEGLGEDDIIVIAREALHLSDQIFSLKRQMPTLRVIGSS